MNIRIFPLVALLILIPLFAEGKALYVNNSGSPGCSDATTYANNSASNPWCTIGRAAWGSTVRSSPNSSQAATAGDTVIVKAGTYIGVGTSHSNSPLYNPINSGTEANPLVFEAEGTVILEFSSGYGAAIGVSSYDERGITGTKNYVTFKGFTIYEINAPGGQDTGLAFIAGGTGNRIENCVLEGDVSSSIASNHAGIWTEPTANLVIKNNKISNILNAGAYHHNGGGIITYESVSGLFENNEISNCGSGIFIKGYENDSNTIRYNYIYGCGSGIKLATTIGTHRVYQNIVRDQSGPGISVHPMVSNGTRGTIYIVNNTIISDYIHFNLSLGSTGQVYTYNNIVSYTSGSGWGVEAAYWDRIDQIHFDYNVYYSVPRYYSYNNQEHVTIGAWRTAIGRCPGTNNDCRSITSNPLFVDAGAGDYRLQTGSPARTIGVDILNLGGGGTSATVPAGAYITGNEVIGQIFVGPSPPTGLTIRYQ